MSGGIEDADGLNIKKYLWGKSRVVRAVFHPLLYATNRNYRLYRFLTKPKAERQKKLKGEMEQWAAKVNAVLPKVNKEDVIGREDEMNLLMYSCRYNILKELHDIKAPPAKVFCIKGSSGVGKTFLASGFAREAFEMALKDGLIVNIDRLKISEIRGQFMGQSTTALGSRLESMLSTPTILIIDEAQALTTRGATEGASSGDLGVMREHQAMESELLQSLDKLSSTPGIRSMVIFLTDKFEYVLDTIRRRSELIDLDANITKAKLVKLSEKLVEKYGIALDPVKIVEIINRELYAFGKRVTTFNDIAKSFEFVVREAERPLREGRATAPMPITYDNFIEAAKTVSSYEFEDMTQTAKSSRIGIRPNNTYADVGGLYGIKDQVIQEMSLILSRNVTEKLKYHLPRGFLFYGSPGSGKTLLAKAIAAETNVPFYYVSAPSLFSKYVGSSEKNLRDIFTSAKREPNGAIIFCDEIDTLGAARGHDEGQNGVQTSLLTELLTQLDGFDSGSNKIIFIGATNRKTVLDPALLDRLPRQIEFTYPKTAVERKEVIAVHINKVSGIAAPDLTVDNVYSVFVKKSFSPRIIADTIELGLRMRAMEILYASESKIASEEKKRELSETFKDAINRITEISGGQADFTKVASALDIPEAWPLTLVHVKKALEMITKDESYEEALEMQRIYITDTPTVGKAYGLAVLGERGDRGMILIVTTNMYKARGNKGKVYVFGDAGRGPQASAEMVVSYLRQFIPEIVDYDVLVHIINPLEGSIEDPHKAAVSGPSIGQALGVSVTSKALKVIRGIDLPILPSVILTGKIEQSDGISGWVGGIHPKETAAKIEIAASEGFKVVSIPIGQKAKLEQDYPEYVEFLKSEGVNIIGAKDLLDNLGYASGLDRDKIVSMFSQQ